MRSKKTFALVIMIIVCFFIIMSGNIYNYINQNKLRYEADKEYEEYLNKVMRFPVEIETGEYNSIDGGDIFLINEEDGDKRLTTVSKKIFIDKISTNYSNYIVTNDTTYIDISMGNETKYIEYLVPINSVYLKNLRNFMREINENSISVFPFNDGIYCLIGANQQQYIFNIELGTIVWTRGGYYESPTVDILNDTLKCGGDLSANTYVFNKYGELIKTITPQIDYIELIVNISKFIIVILVLIFIKSMIKSNVKNNIIKNLVNIFIILITIILFLLLAMTVALMIAV